MVLKLRSNSNKVSRLLPCPHVYLVSVLILGALSWFPLLRSLSQSTLSVFFFFPPAIEHCFYFVLTVVDQPLTRLCN